MQSNTNWNLYRSFIAVYEAKNIQHAANILNITRTGVALNIKELSKQLGVQLFIPERRGVKPTNEATELYEQISHVFSTLKFAEQNIGDFGPKSRGVIRIACVTNFDSLFLHKAIVKFRKTYTYIKFEIYNRTLDESLRLLRMQDVDIVFSMVPVEASDTSDFNVKQIGSFKNTFFASSEFVTEHKLGGVVNKELFLAQPLVLGTTHLYFIPNDIKPSIYVERQELQIGLVSQNAGIGMLIEDVLDTLAPDKFVKIRIDGIHPQDAIISCIHQKNFLSKAGKEFLKLLYITT